MFFLEHIVRIPVMVTFCTKSLEKLKVRLFYNEYFKFIQNLNLVCDRDRNDEWLLKTAISATVGRLGFR